MKTKRIFSVFLFVAAIAFFAVPTFSNNTAGAAEPDKTQQHGTQHGPRERYRGPNYNTPRGPRDGFPGPRRGVVPDPGQKNPHNNGRRPHEKRGDSLPNRAGRSAEGEFELVIRLNGGSIKDGGVFKEDDIIVNKSGELRLTHDVVRELFGNKAPYQKNGGSDYHPGGAWDESESGSIIETPILMGLFEDTNGDGVFNQGDKLYKSGSKIVIDRDITLACYYNNNGFVYGRSWGDEHNVRIVKAWESGSAPVHESGTEFHYTAKDMQPLYHQVTTVGKDAFSAGAWLDAVKTVQLPDTVTDILERAFEQLSGLTSIRGTENVKHIAPNAFRATKITEIILGGESISIGQWALNTHSDKLNIIFKTVPAGDIKLSNKTWGTPYWIGVNEPSAENPKAHIYVPKGETKAFLDKVHEKEGYLKICNGDTPTDIDIQIREFHTATFVLRDEITETEGTESKIAESKTLGNQNNNHNNAGAHRKFFKHHSRHFDMNKRHSINDSNGSDKKGFDRNMNHDNAAKQNNINDNLKNRDGVLNSRKHDNSKNRDGVVNNSRHNNFRNKNGVLNNEKREKSGNNEGILNIKKHTGRGAFDGSKADTGNGIFRRGAENLLNQDYSGKTVTKYIDAGAVIYEIEGTNVNGEARDVNLNLLHITAGKIGTEHKGRAIHGYKDENGYLWSEGDFGVTGKIFSENKIFRRVYEDEVSTVTYNLSGGTLEGAGEHKSFIGGRLQGIGTPAKENYNFAGWFKNAEYTEPFNFENDTVSSSAFGLFAKFEAVKHQITYHLNEGTHGENYPTEYSHENAVTLVSPNKAGHNFEGWYTNAEFTGSPVTAIAAGNTGNIEYYAKWSTINNNNNNNPNNEKGCSCASVDTFGGVGMILGGITFAVAMTAMLLGRKRKSMKPFNAA